MNKLYPGKPNYIGPKKGLFTLLHHKGPLIESSDDVMERIKYIKSEKAAHEIPIRLRHIVFVPKKMQPKALQKAYADWQKAYADRQKADADRQKAYADRQKAYADWQKAYADRQKAYADWQKAYADWQKAYADWQKADADWQKAYADWQKADADWQKADDEKLLAYLHKHVKDCKWNGNEIVFTEK